MRKKWFMILLSLCLLFCLPLTAAASSESASSESTSDDDALREQLMRQVDLAFLLNNSSSYPLDNVRLYDFNSAVVTQSQVNGTFSYHHAGNDVYYENYEGAFSSVEFGGSTTLRFSGRTTLHFIAYMPTDFVGVYGSGIVNQNITFGDISYYAYDSANAVWRKLALTDTNIKVVDASFTDNSGGVYQSFVALPGTIGGTSYINHRFGDACIGTRSIYMRVDVEYDFAVSNLGANSIMISRDLANGYAQLAVNNCAGYARLSEVYLDYKEFNSRYNSVLESQNEQMMNGYDNSSGAAALESGAASVDIGIQEEHAAIDNAGSLAADYDYESADMSELATAFSLISGWFMSLIEALGSWNMLIYITLTMVVALFAIGYFRH